MAANPVIRLAVMDDLDALMALEESVFAMDRLSRRAMAYAIKSPSQIVVTVWQDAALIASAIIGFRAGSALARLSSIAVAAKATGRGIGRLLLRTSEIMAAERGAKRLRLEVRADNEAAIRLYARNDYSLFGRYEDYYEDGTAALRFEKTIR